ncbi:MAG: hypothetical protein VX343_00895 [Thermodesulfobacteriota bacterium]|nr:hypothetical protein [Thermodesulfobacteriota bacterium]
MSISKKILLTYIAIFSVFLSQEVVSSQPDSREKELEIRRNINNADLSKLKIVDFKWLTKAKGTIGKFQEIRIKNSSIVGFKNISLELQIYNRAGTLTRHSIPIKDTIGPNQTIVIKNISTPILPFVPATTIIAIKSADIMYDSEEFSFKAKKAIKILDFKFVVDDSSTKTIIVEKLVIENKSKNYYENIEFVLNFMHKNKIVASRGFLIKESIGPGASKIIKNFNVPGIPTRQFKDVYIEVESAKMVSSKQYLTSGGDEEYLAETGDIDIDDSPVPKLDLKLQGFAWVNNAKYSMGSINLDLANNSRFKYNEIEIFVNYKTSRGNMLTRDRVVIKDDIEPYSQKTFNNIQIGYIQYETGNVHVTIENASMIGSIQPKRITKSKTKTKTNTNRKNKEKSFSKELFIPKRELIIIDYDIKDYGSIKIFNRSDAPISDIKINVQLLKENKIIKEYNLTIDDTISPRQEKTFRSLELTGANNIDFTYVNILIKEGKRPLKDNKNRP